MARGHPIITFETMVTQERDGVSYDQDLTVHIYTIEPADTSVGIMSDGPGDYAILNSDGVDVSDDYGDQLMDEMCDRVREATCQPADDTWPEYQDE